MKDEWQSVQRELPKHDGPVLIYAPSAEPDRPLIHIAWYDPRKGWSLLPRVWLEAITHWMPLPKPPKRVYERQENPEMIVAAIKKELRRSALEVAQQLEKYFWGSSTDDTGRL